jgi:hypothetical protein
MFWFLLVSVASFGVFFGIVLPELQKFRVTADIIAKIETDGVTRWQKIKLWLLGLKTPLSGLIGVLVTALPGALEQLHLVDFSAFFTADIALKISGAIMLLMTVTHIFGIAAAAKIEPKKED